ncbi:MAG: enoyl-CoA hydratase/isomerase family protein [Candidatus Omnitrophota bacterium]
MCRTAALGCKVFLAFFLPIVLSLAFPAPLMASPVLHLRAPATAKDGADRIIQDFRRDAARDGGDRVIQVEDKLIEGKGVVRFLRINRPEKFNAANEEVLDQLEEAFSEAENDPNVKVIVLTGTGGKAFMAGADISVFEGITADKMRAFIERGQKLTDQIDYSKKPVIGAINGLALGGGLEFMLSTHYTVAVKSAKFGAPEITLGIIPGWGGTQRLTRKVGPKNALPLLLNGAIIGAREAEEIGLVNEVVEDEAALLARVEAIAADPSQIPARKNWDSIAAPQKFELEKMLDTPAIQSMLFVSPKIPFGAEFQSGTEQIVRDRMAAARVILEAVWRGHAWGILRGLEAERDGIVALVESEGGKRGVRAFVNKERAPAIKFLPSAKAARTKEKWTKACPALSAPVSIRARRQARGNIGMLHPTRESAGPKTVVINADAFLDGPDTLLGIQSYLESLGIGSRQETVEKSRVKLYLSVPGGVTEDEAEHYVDQLLAKANELTDGAIFLSRASFSGVVPGATLSQATEYLKGHFGVTKIDAIVGPEKWLAGFQGKVPETKDALAVTLDLSPDANQASSGASAFLAAIESLAKGGVIDAALAQAINVQIQSENMIQVTPAPVSGQVSEDLATYRQRMSQV